MLTHHSHDLTNAETSAGHWSFTLFVALFHPGQAQRTLCQENAPSSGLWQTCACTDAQRGHLRIRGGKGLVSVGQLRTIWVCISSGKTATLYFCSPA